MNEQELNQLMNQEKGMLPNSEQEKRFQNKIRKTMNRTIYCRILIIFTLAAAAGIMVVWLTSAVMNLMFYDPGREEPFLSDYYTGDAEFGILFEDAMQMHYPGKDIEVATDFWDSYHSKGFGRYEGTIYIQDQFRRDIAPAYDFYIQYSRLTVKNAMLYRTINEFVEPGTETEYLRDPNPELLEDLPDSAVVNVSMSLDCYLSSDQIAQLMEQFPGVRFQWLALKGQGHPVLTQIAGGMALSYTRMHEFSEDALLRYPGYYLPEHMTGHDLEQCLISRLQLLADHPDFLSLMEETFDIQGIPDRLNAAKNEWACYGIRLMAEKEDMAALLKQLPVRQLIVHDVKISWFQK